LEKLGVNPFDNASREERDMALRQYAALLHKIDTGEIARHLQAQRSREAARVMHEPGTLAWQRMGAAFTLGLYHHREAATPEMLATVDRQRRIEWHERYLEQVLASGPRPEVVADMASVRRSIAALTSLASGNAEDSRRASKVVSAILSRSGDEATRQECVRCLSRLSEAVPVATPPDTVVASSGESQ
jgi:hypothetical protein